MTAEQRRGYFVVVQDAEGVEETELVTIDESGSAPVIELSDGTRITCLMPARGGRGAVENETGLSC